MVEFRFDIRPLFQDPIVKVSSNLLPHTFRGDRRQALDTTSKMSEIIDRLGQLSAAAQKLTKPVTTAQKLRMSENQIIYLLADINAGHNGSVIGLLKVGTKDLYLFDESGETQKVANTPCILDFYIHETRQRAGLGKDLFETMLADEHWTPIKCSIDRPSEKLLGFMRKHYGLNKAIPQANNFVLYEGFFDEMNPKSLNKQATNGLHITNSPNTQLFGAHYLGDDINKRRGIRNVDSSKSVVQVTQISPVGRYGAPRPTCSMAEARKNPLDALSRMSVRYPTLEKRSGLDNIYENRGAVANQNPNPLQQAPLSQTQSAFKLQTGADGNAAAAYVTPSQAQMQQNQQQLQQGQPQQMQAQMMQAQQMQAQQQQMQPNMTCKNQSLKESHGSAQQPMSNMPATSATTMNNTHQEPDMCTTCPNCQTTIYLVRGNEHDAAAAQSLHHHQQQQQLQPNAAGQQQQQMGGGGGGVHHVNHENNVMQSPIIHSNSTPNKGGAETSSHRMQQFPLDSVDAIADDLLKLHTAMEQLEDDVQSLAGSAENLINDNNNADADALSNVGELLEHAKVEITNTLERSRPPSIIESISSVKKTTTFHLSKQHTGMKNRSFGVGMAVTPTNKMEFDQEDREDFGIVKINRPIGKITSPTADNTDAMSTVSSSGEGITDQGYHDLKFYHNKLW